MLCYVKQLQLNNLEHNWLYKLRKVVLLLKSDCEKNTTVIF